jgi:hypothetical protein
MRAKTSLDPQPPTKFAPDLDPHLEEIVLHAIERLPNNRYRAATDMLKDLQDPSRVKPTGRAHRLHPQNLRAQQLRRTAAIGLFFVSLVGVFVFLIWLANRFPAAPTQHNAQTYRGQVH